jgi:putative MATE family efflux protein
MNTTQHYSLKDDPILKLLFVYAGPAVVGLLINALYNIVDRIFVGQFVGAEGLSAVTLAFPVTNFQFAFVLLFGSGAGVLIAKNLGENRKDNAEIALGNMLAGLSIPIVLFTTAGLLFYQPLLRAFGAQGSLLNLSADYLQIIVMGFPFSFFLAFEFTCRAEGNPRLPAILILVSSIINISLDYLLMKVFGMGIRGAAFATVTAQATNAILIMRYYLRGKSQVKLVMKNVKLQKHIILPILSIGLAPFFMDCAMSLQNVLANNLLLKSGGIYAVAAMGIIFGVNVFFMMTALGTGDGMQPIISFNYGARRTDRIRQTLMYALRIVSLVAALGIILIELFPTQITAAFVNGKENITDIARTALRIFALSIPFYMGQIVITRYFQAIQANRIATFLAILRPVLIFIPMVYALNGMFGLNGIWLSFPVSDSLAVLISLLLVRKPNLFKSGNGSYIAKRFIRKLMFVR